MGTKFFINLPVKNLQRSTEFFTKLGFHFNPNFSDEHATCMIIGDDSFVMLLVEKFFKTFTTKHICDTTKSIESIVSLSVETKERVNEIIASAVTAGGTTPIPKEDDGFMYLRNFEDLDGHQWEILWMDPTAHPQEE